MLGPIDRRIVGVFVGLDKHRTYTKSTTAARAQLVANSRCPPLETALPAGLLTECGCASITDRVSGLRHFGQRLRMSRTRRVVPKEVAAFVSKMPVPVDSILGDDLGHVPNGGQKLAFLHIDDLAPYASGG